MQHPSTYQNQKVVVLGLARSGVSIAKTMHRLGAKVIVNDQKPQEASPEADELVDLGIEVITGGHPDHLVDKDTALLIKNPGIPYTAAPIVDALSLGIEVATEVEAAGLLSVAPIVGITGSNGKTTTTTWIGDLLRGAGLRPIVAGNIGRPLCEAAEEADANQWIVAELSSFQLKGTQTFRPRVAVLLNLTETHLDYHKTMDDYTGSKAKLFSQQEASDFAVYNYDDLAVRQMAEAGRATRLPFSCEYRLTSGVYLDPPIVEGDDGLMPAEASRFVYAHEGQVQVVASANDLSIPGRHNIANALAAIAAAIAAGVDPAGIAASIRQFRAVEHRLERVREAGSVVYYNDSKATNAKATIMALTALSEPVVWIGGGLDRGSDYLELLPVLKQRVKAAVLIGQTRSKLAAVAEQAGLTKVVIVEPNENAELMVQEAVQQAAALAEPGDAVLLSPACASWDMFETYEQRGRMFADSVHKL